MPRFKLKGVFERNALADLWKHTLSHIPTVFGRLVYLADLRDPNSGAYRHHGLTTVFGREESKKAMTESHEQVFAEWLQLPLIDKSWNLKSYLDSLDEPRDVVVKHWLRSAVYKSYYPLSARESEQEMYFQEMQMLLEILKAEGGGGGTDRGSLRLA